MNTILCRPVRTGLILSTLVALLAFAARLAEAQPAPQRSTPAHAVPIAPRPSAIVRGASR